ncbi:hypothetical protein ElyMa_001392800 [Elysia marginata]|uniref:Uncharacterized protein n=1 Tax=Elysia marginata TaxID=1093978 RepID=A0AAV4IT25_9GAST|nr:hypothetical protein ElyMa_001392800 [Elysia marginata]
MVDGLTGHVSQSSAVKIALPWVLLRYTLLSSARYPTSNSFAMVPKHSTLRPRPYCARPISSSATETNTATWIQREQRPSDLTGSYDQAVFFPLYRSFPIYFRGWAGQQIGSDGGCSCGITVGVFVSGAGLDTDQAQCVCGLKPFRGTTNRKFIAKAEGAAERLGLSADASPVTVQTTVRLARHELVDLQLVIT